MHFPADLRQKISELTAGLQVRSLADAAKTVSDRYRRTVTADLQIQNEIEAKAYIAARLPATFGVAGEVLTRLNNIWSEMQPQSILDLGAGPGTATLAARQIWPNLSATLVERNRYLQAIGEQLLETGDWKAQSLHAFMPENHDIVIASYVLNEIADLSSLIERFWASAAKAFVIIEPGTPQGYDVVIKARDILLRQGAFIAAPCPHHFTCPLINSGMWCHFSKRIERSQLHRLLKEEASLPYEDEKFSYLVATRQGFEHPTFRTLGHPHGEKLVEIETCQQNGSFEIIKKSRRDPEFKKIKRLDWGDAYFDEV